MALLSLTIGNMLEWYEFALFSAFTPIIGKLFYPSLDPISQYLAIFAVYASGFIARPLGGIVLGYIGEKKGRKYVLSLSIIMMAIPTTMIGLLPGYNQIGVMAPILLLILRLVQSFSMGGEFTSSMVFMVEHYCKSKLKYFYSSFAPFSLAFGVALGGMAASAIHFIFSPVFVEIIGWRIPFILSMSGSMLGLYARKSLSEPDKEIANQSIVEKPLYLSYIYVLMIDMLVAVGFFFTSAFLLTYLNYFLGHDLILSSKCVMYSLLSMAFMIPISGLICDILRGHRIVQSISCILMIIFAFNIVNNMKYTPEYNAIMLGGLIGMYFCAIPISLCNLFPNNLRLISISIMHNISMTFFGGTIPFIMTNIMSMTNMYGLMPGLILSLSAFISLLGILYSKRD